MPEETHSPRRWWSLSSLQEFENDSCSSCGDEEYESEQMDDAADEESTTSDEYRTRRRKKRSSDLQLPLMDRRAFLDVGCAGGVGSAKSKNASSTMDLSRAHRDRHGHAHRVRSSSDVRFTPLTAAGGHRGTPHQTQVLKRKISRAELIAPAIERNRAGLPVPKTALAILLSINETGLNIERAVNEKQNLLERYRELNDQLHNSESAKTEQRPKSSGETETSPSESPPDVEPTADPDGSPKDIRRRYRCCIQNNEELIRSIMEFLAVRRSIGAPRLSLDPIGSGRFEVPTNQVLEIMLLLNSQLGKLLVCNILESTAYLHIFKVE